MLCVTCFNPPLKRHKKKKVGFYIHLLCIWWQTLFAKRKRQEDLPESLDNFRGLPKSNLTHGAKHRIFAPWGHCKLGTQTKKFPKWLWKISAIVISGPLFDLTQKMLSNHVSNHFLLKTWDIREAKPTFGGFYNVDKSCSHRMKLAKGFLLATNARQQQEVPSGTAAHPGHRTPLPGWLL